MGEILNAQEAADFLRMSRPALYNAIQRRELAFIRMGKRRVRFRRSDLESFIEKRVVNPAAPVDLRRRRVAG